MSEQLALLPDRLTAHLQLTLLALLVGTAVSLPLGILVTRVRWLEQPALAIAGVIQTVPSLALLAMMVPVLAALELQSIGFLPAIIGLTLYGVLPVLRNTVTGIAGVDPALKEAARGVGMTPSQQLRRVELPLAMPVIVAGIRTSTVWIVGIATLSTPSARRAWATTSSPGSRRATTTPCSSAAWRPPCSRFSLDGLVRALEDGVRTRQRRRVTIALAVLAVLYGYTGLSFASTHLLRGDAPISIGAKTFTEQYILSAMLGQWVEQETGRPTTVVQSLGSIVAFDALSAGDIDIYVDYSGTLWANEMGRDTVLTDRAGRASRRHRVSPGGPQHQPGQHARLRELLRAGDARARRRGARVATHQRPDTARAPSVDRQ